MKRSTWHFVADLHLGHTNIIKYCNRPFMTPQEKALAEMAAKGFFPAKEITICRESCMKMTDSILDNINSTVDVDDFLVIAGDFCFTPKQNRFEIAKKYRERIKCKKVFLVLGNHDDRQLLKPLFEAVYDQYTFKIDGQSVFANHYPARSWDKANHGAWMVYGHVHANLTPEDNGELRPYEKSIFSQGFAKVLSQYNIPENDELVNQLMDVVASTKGCDLTVDVGVDNRTRGLDIPFGTPWSMDDLAKYMGEKKQRWLERQEILKQISSPLSLKNDPKY